MFTFTRPRLSLQPGVDITPPVPASLPLREKPAPFEVLDVYRNPCRMISIIVSPEGGIGKPKTFTVHEPLLSASSAYFCRLLKPSSSLPLNDAISLEGHDAAVFGLVNEYLNTGQITAPKHAPLFSLPNGPQRQNLTWMTKLCRVWLLAYCLEMAELINYAMWCLLVSFDHGMGMDGRDIEDIYYRAPTNCKLQMLLLDLCTWAPGEFCVEEEEEVEGEERGRRGRKGLGMGMVGQIEKRQMMRKRLKENARNPLADVRNYYVGEEMTAEAIVDKEQRERDEKMEIEEDTKEQVDRQFEAFTFKAGKAKE